jgi:hypothetical protein
MALRPMAEGPVLVGIRPIFRSPLVHAHALELCRSKRQRPLHLAADRSLF